jgi:hypothetical protein
MGAEKRNENFVLCAGAVWAGWGACPAQACKDARKQADKAYQYRLE